jgi:hypothetical protein
MSDDPTFDDDELVSAYVDGEATPEEVAAVEADPHLLARVEVLRAVARAVASAPVAPAPEDARETSIAAALAAAGSHAEVTDLAAVRARRPLRVLSIAAAVLIALAIGAGLLAQANRDSTSSSAAKTSAAGSGASSSSSSSAAADERAAADQAAPTPNTFGALAAPDLGDYDDAAVLVAAAKGRLDATKSTGGSPSAAGPAAGSATAPQDSAAAGGAEAATCPRPVDVVFEGVARLDGAPVTVVVFGPQDRQVIELVDATCAVVLSQPL